ncbi:MAG: histidine kinase dimerization/phospho-acceptor domain-containing protein [Ilumatobacteraceae bacterium]
MLLGLPLQDTWQLVAISFGVSAVIGLAGRALLDRLRSTRLAFQGLIVIFVAVGATLGGALVAAKAMFVSTHDLKALLVVTVGAGTMATLAGMHLARQVDAASRSLGEVARQIGLGGTAIDTDPHNLPEELARLGNELTEMRTRLDEARLRAQRLEQSRREVIAWVSHDLRTPIARMRAMIEAINDGVIDEQSTVDRYHLTMQSEVEQLGRLVDDLFELSRIQAGAVRLTLEPVVVAELVSDTIASARAIAEHKSVRLVGDALDQGAVAELSIPEMARAAQPPRQRDPSQPVRWRSASCSRHGRRRGGRFRQRPVRRHRRARSRPRVRARVPRRHSSIIEAQRDPSHGSSDDRRRSRSRDRQGLRRGAPRDHRGAQRGRWLHLHGLHAAAVRQNPAVE